MQECFAGRKAFFGGRWTEPCPYDGDAYHHVFAPGDIEIVLCPDHFDQVLEAGLVSQPYISREGAEHFRRQ